MNFKMKGFLATSSCLCMDENPDENRGVVETEGMVGNETWAGARLTILLPTNTWPWEVAVALVLLHTGWRVLSKALKSRGLAGGWEEDGLKVLEVQSSFVSTVGCLRLSLYLATPPFIPTPTGMPMICNSSEVRMLSWSRNDLRQPLSWADAITCEQIEKPLNIGQNLSQKKKGPYYSLGS